MDVLYDATGVKWRKTTMIAESATENLYYIDGIEYKSAAQPVAIMHEVGRYVFGAQDNYYEYTLRDHLGNTRITFKDANGDGAPEALQENHYYPFGLQMESAYFVQATTSPNHYTYSGKELVADLGIEWSDFGARWYDAAVGRWWSVDPMAERRYFWNAYNYGRNNPMKNIDPNGMLDANTNFYGYKPDEEIRQQLESNKNAAESEKKKQMISKFIAGTFADATIKASSLNLETGETKQNIGRSQGEHNESKSTTDAFLTPQGEKVQPQQGTISVNNQSDFSIWAKPEEGDEPIEITAHSTYDQPIDGIAASHIKKNAVYKSVTGVSLAVSNTGVSWQSHSYAEYLGQVITGGWIVDEVRILVSSPAAASGVGASVPTSLYSQLNWTKLYGKSK